MPERFPHLFSPIEINGLRLRNRIVSTPHTTLYTTDSLPDDREAHYQAEKAKGGCGFQFLGAALVHPTSGVVPGMVINQSDAIIPRYRRIAEMVHRHGGRVGAQLSHYGANIDVLPDDGRPPVGPSGQATDLHRLIPRRLSETEIAEIVAAFGAAAARVRAGGFDAVMFHGGHGNLPNQFLSPVFNRRTDRYGGSVERRTTFVRECLRAIRGAVGDDFPVGIRLSVVEFLDGGLTVEASQQIARLLDAERLVDWIDCSWGSDSSPFPRAYHYASMYVPQGVHVDLAAAIKRVVSVPVTAVGRIVDPRQAEQVLADGKCDLVAMTRAQIADPHLANKARAGRLEEIRPCIGANEGCLEHFKRGLPIGCISRPTAGREGEWPEADAEIESAARSWHVAVVGGGPAGLEAARVAALRGHQVTLYERELRLGGQLRLAAQLPGRAEINRLTDWLVWQIRRPGPSGDRPRVELRLGQPATPDRLVGYDAVILATGSRALSAWFPGAEGRALAAREIVGGAPVAPGAVLVLDGDGYFSGAGTADLLAGRGHRVTLATRGYHAAEMVDHLTRVFLLRRLYEQGVTMLPFTWLRRLEGDVAVLVNTLTGAEQRLAGITTVVAAVGSDPDDELTQALQGHAGGVHLIGDCLAPRRIEEAIAEGHAVARRLGT